VVLFNGLGGSINPYGLAILAGAVEMRVAKYFVANFVGFLSWN
jgi:hypothetical protein